MKEKEKTIYNLKLHEALNINDRLSVRVVPSGWIYTQEWQGSLTSSFVPFSNEFKK